jgi:hypothetical protein
VKVRAEYIVALVAFVIVGVPFTLIALQTSFIEFDGNRVTSVCARLVPGTSPADAKRIATSAGVGQLVPPYPHGPDGLGSYDETEGIGFFRYL